MTPTHAFICELDQPCPTCHPTPGYMGGFIGDCLACRRTHGREHDGHNHRLVGRATVTATDVLCDCKRTPACGKATS